jgi:hypothetical protein
MPRLVDVVAAAHQRVIALASWHAVGAVEAARLMALAKQPRPPRVAAPKPPKAAKPEKPAVQQQRRVPSMPKLSFLNGDV